MYYKSLIETIGNTPLVKLNHIGNDVPGTILVKVEYFNPGHSMKDRMAIKMIEDAEKDGRLKPGGTIIEGTSGNTGMGLALGAIAKGYKCIFTLSDKQSKEKIDILRAMGAEVIVCPTNVPPEDPASYYAVAQKLNKEISNSFYPNQYDNLSNFKAHYETTGPEIWEQTGGEISHYAAGVGTGGSMCGVSKYLKEQNKKVFSIGIDTYGSVFTKFKETGKFDEKEVYPYLTEGIGEDILPKNVDFDLIDTFVKVTDKDGAVMTRKLAKEEGLFVGWSSGSAVHGALEYARTNLKKDDTMVIILPDHGTRYLNKVYNDDWMRDRGFLEEREFATAKDIIQHRNGARQLVTVDGDAVVSEAIGLLHDKGFSQIPVTVGDALVGSIRESNLLKRLIEEPDSKFKKIKDIMDDPLPFVGFDNTLDVLSSVMDHDHQAILVRDEANRVHIITKQDLLLEITK